MIEVGVYSGHSEYYFRLLNSDSELSEYGAQSRRNDVEQQSVAIDEANIHAARNQVPEFLGMCFHPIGIRKWALPRLFRNFGAVYGSGPAASTEYGNTRARRR